MPPCCPIAVGPLGADRCPTDRVPEGEQRQIAFAHFSQPDDDKLPERVRKAFSEGPAAGSEISAETIDWAKRRYYEMMGWDERGVPRRATLYDHHLEQTLDH